MQQGFAKTSTKEKDYILSLFSVTTTTYCGKINPEEIRPWSDQNQGGLLTSVCVSVVALFDVYFTNNR